jgi:2-oxoglutarate dehydrogenase E2 component (dihydrolipoamide succinyltransferase)
MAKFDIVMPKMGESVQEATIIQWFKKEGDKIEEDDILLEIGTDKVDSEIPSPVDGVLSKILFQVNDVVPVGEVIAVIDMGGETAPEKDSDTSAGPKEKASETAKKESAPEVSFKETPETKEKQSAETDYSTSGRFYSPLVKSIAREENISVQELESIKGSGREGRVKKQDVFEYIQNKGKQPIEAKATANAVSATTPPSAPKVTVSVNPGDEIVQMDRMRKMIAEHMVMSKQVSPHVTNFIEVDVTNMVRWREKVKGEFKAREKQNITYMPIITEAVAKSLKDFPGVNASVDGDKIILRKNINIGIAVALPNGNLIVPVVKNADQKNLLGITSSINELANNARNNKLNPDDVAGGTFSISNFGTFRNLTGTPIINQPQVAILAVGTIEKKPAVLETPSGDVIAIRHKMILSLSYDHRVIDGALGGEFLKRLADYLEGFDVNRTI